MKKRRTDPILFPAILVTAIIGMFAAITAGNALIDRAHRAAAGERHAATQYRHGEACTKHHRMDRHR